MRGVRAIAVAALVLVVGFSLFLATRDPAGTPTEVTAGERPEFVVETLDGDEIPSSTLDGTVTYINFWNTWCEPCQEEEPVLIEFFTRHRNDPDFRMLAIANQDTRGNVSSWVAANADISWDVVWDPDENAAGAFGVTGQPESFMLDTAGRIVALQKGPMTLAGLESMLTRARSQSNP